MALDPGFAPAWAKVSWASSILYAVSTPTPALAHLIVDEQGFSWLAEADFVGHFAADVEPARARVMFAAQPPP